MFILPPDEFDFDTSEKVVEALTHLPAQTLEAFERVMKSAARHQAMDHAHRAQIHHLNVSARDDRAFMEDYERAARHADAIDEDYAAKYRRASASYAKKRAEVKALQQRGVEPNLPLNRLVEFAVDLSPTEKFAHVPTDVKLAKGQTFTAALESARDKLAEIAQQRRAVFNAPLPLADAKKRIEEDVYRHALAPDVSGTARIRTSVFGTNGQHETQGHVNWPTAQIVHDGGATSEIGEGVRFLCWLMPREIVAKAMADLEATYQGKTPLSLEEREAKLAQLDTLRLETEREEEAIVRLLEDGGTTVARRPQASLEAVLQIRRA